MTSREPPSLVEALTDTRFQVFATPIVIRWIYRLCAAAIALITGCWMATGLWVASWRNGWIWGGMLIAIAPLVGLISLMAIRVLCEFVLARMFPSR